MLDNLSENKDILLINSFGIPISIMNELLKKELSDSSVYISYPLGVLTLAGWCQQELPNYKIQILDLMMDLHKYISNVNSEAIDPELFIENKLNCIERSPDYIGISINFSNGHSSSLKVAEMCKQKWPDSIIIAGGMHATTFSEDIINDKNIDYLIRGPGDISFIQLLKSLSKNTGLDNIPGVVTSMNDISNIGLVVKELDDIPRFPYELIDMEYLLLHESTSPIVTKNARIGVVFMSRGCPYPCTYCSASKIHGKKIYFNSVSHVVDEIEYLINRYDVNQLNIIDDLFGAKKQYFLDVFEEIDRRNLDFHLSIPAGLAVSVYDEEMIDVLVKHGLEAVYFPLESGSPYVQEHIIKKRVNINKAIRLLEYTRSKGVFAGVNIVIGSPGETKELINQTFDFLMTAPVDWIAFFIAYPYPGTEMTDVLLDSGEITKADLINIWDNSTQGFKERPFDTNDISGKEIYDLVYDYNITLNFFNNYNIVKGNYRRIIPKLNKIINNHPWHIVAISCLAKCHYELGEIDVAINYAHQMPDLVLTETLAADMFKKYKNKILETIDPFSMDVYADLI